MTNNNFPSNVPTANPVFYRTYSRRKKGTPTSNDRENWVEVVERTTAGLKKLGKLTDDETELIYRMQSELKCLTSGRWLWVGGTDWIEKPENFYGAYNCSSTNITDWAAFGLLMNLAMTGCGTGAVLEDQYISKLPAIRNKLNVEVRGEIGSVSPELRAERTLVYEREKVNIIVGDSRQGWVSSYQKLLELSTSDKYDGEVDVVIDVSNVRMAGEALKGFGGVANPIKLKELYTRCAKILNKAVGRQLDSVECCLLIDEAALCVVAGNIRRCLAEDTKISTPNGTVLIKDIKIGDLVKTPIGDRRVTNKFDQGVQVIYQIETISEWATIYATANHRFAVKTTRGDETLIELSQINNKREEIIKLDKIEWKAIKDLDAEKDWLIDIYGDAKLIDWIDHPQNMQTYDIEVEEAHCFYANGFLSHNSAGIKQADKSDLKFASAKEGMWKCDDNGKWSIDPDKDALRMSNHTRVFHTKPTLEECIDAVSRQYYTGEGAIQWAGEAIARANADVLDTPEKKKRFLDQYSYSKRCGGIELQSVMTPPIKASELDDRLKRYGLNPCGK